jgi:antitoxin (DNA-binding transcriptional repressor) of toxin-antitoxin stability system
MSASASLWLTPGRLRVACGKAVHNTLTLNGEPLAKMIPIRRRTAVPKEEVLAIFATAPVVDARELRADLDQSVSQELYDPYEGIGL